MTLPKHQTTIIGRRLLPHWTLRPATVSGASTSIETMPKLEGFQRWRPSTRRTYFEVMEMAEHRAYGHIAGDRTSMPTLMPEMYELARCGQAPENTRASTSSMAMAVAMASAVRDQLSRNPNVTWPRTSTTVTRMGAR